MRHVLFMLKETEDLSEDIDGFIFVVVERSIISEEVIKFESCRSYSSINKSKIIFCINNIKI